MALKPAGGDLKKLKLPPSMSIDHVDGKGFFLTIDRKSRIVMKDGEKLLKLARKIWEQFPHAPIEIRATAAICSKTRQFLTDNGINVRSHHLLSGLEM